MKKTALTLIFAFVTLLGWYSCTNNSNFDTIIIKTNSATYHYQSEAGGFSSVIDSDSNDWVSFKYEKDAPYPQSAESMSRGLPNLVYKGKNDGVGHPGFTKCTSKQINDSTIKTFSKNSLWEYDLIFHSNFVYLDIIKTDPEQNYWFLYEGTPNGNWDPENYFWGTNEGGPYFTLNDFYNNDEKYGHWNWAYFGTLGKSGIFYVMQVESDTLIDLCGYLGNSIDGLNSDDGMVVFGFGRNNIDHPTALLNNPEDFVFGFIDVNITDSSAHELIYNRLNNKREIFLKDN